MSTIFDNNKLKQLKRKTTAIFTSLSSLNYVNEFLMWTKQILIDNDVANIDNSKEILNKANKMHETIYNYLQAQLELLNKWNDNVSFLIDCESLFAQEEYMEFRVHWSQLQAIINDNDQEASIDKINKLKEFSKFWRRYLINSQNDK